MSDRPIADRVLLGDCRSAPLVDRDRPVEWLCFPRFDSPSVFARLVDDSEGGHFPVRPVGEAEVTRRYVDGSLVAATEFRTAGGVLELTDVLAMADGVRGHDLGQDSPHVLLRRAVCTGGQVELAVAFAARYEHGLRTPRATSAARSAREARPTSPPPWRWISPGAASACTPSRPAPPSPRSTAPG